MSKLFHFCRGERRLLTKISMIVASASGNLPMQRGLGIGNFAESENLKGSRPAGARPLPEISLRKISAPRERWPISRLRPFVLRPSLPRGGGVGRAPKAARLRRSGRWRWRISTSDDLCSWCVLSSARYGWRFGLEHRMPRQCGGCGRGMWHFSINAAQIRPPRLFLKASDFQGKSQA